MSAYSDNKSKFKISPWDELGFKIEMIDLFEEIGGNIAGGEIILSYLGTKSSWDDLLKNNTGILEMVDTSGDAGKVILTIPYFITNRVVNNNFLTLNIICVNNRKFTDRISTMEFDNLSRAIKDLYPGKVYSNVGPDCNVNSQKIRQFCETDYELCNKLCLSYRQGVVFSYGIKGLYIKDITLNQRTKENSFMIGDSFETSTVPSYSQSRILDHIPFNCWSQKGQGEPTKKSYIANLPKYCTSLGFFNENHIVGGTHEIMLNNYLYNCRMMNEMNMSTIVNFYGLLPVFEPGDVIFLNNGVEGNSNNFKKYVVRSNELFFAAGENQYFKFDKKFINISKLVSFETGNWISNIY